MDEMKTVFRDAKGRDWVVNIPYSTYRRVKAVLQINLEDLIVTPKDKDDLPTAPLAKLCDDLDQFINLIHEILRPDCEARSVTREDFEAALDGDAMSGALHAFIGALYAFSRSAAKKALLKDAWTKGMAAESLLMDRAAKEMPKTTKLMIDNLNLRFDEELTRLYGSSPELQALTPTP